MIHCAALATRSTWPEQHVLIAGPWHSNKESDNKGVTVVLVTARWMSRTGRKTKFSNNRRFESVLHEMGNTNTRHLHSLMDWVSPGDGLTEETKPRGQCSTQKCYGTVLLPDALHSTAGRHWAQSSLGETKEGPERRIEDHHWFDSDRTKETVAPQ